MDFHRQYIAEKSIACIQDAVTRGDLSGDGLYTEKCTKWLEERLGNGRVLMMTSGTHALELAVRLAGIGPGDEVILPSFTFPSTANAVLLAGGTVVYSEVEQAYLTLDPERLEEKITARTRAILPVHYGGNVCDMEPLMAIARRHGLVVIEDAAQSFLSTWHGRQAGTFGDYGCFSFHGTKNVAAGEGGALVCSNPDKWREAVRFRQKGTNRELFDEGAVSRYEWTQIGSSWSPSDLLMAYLYGQLESSGTITEKRLALFRRYEAFFSGRQPRGVASSSSARKGGTHNGHLFHVAMETEEAGRALKAFLEERGIPAPTHFVPLHESAMGRQFIRPVNDFRVEQGLGVRLVRLPLHTEMTLGEQDRVLEALEAFFHE